MRAKKHPGLETIIRESWISPCSPHVVDVLWEPVTPEGPKLVLTMRAPDEWGSYVSWRELRGEWFAMLAREDYTGFIAEADCEMNALLRLHKTPENRMTAWAHLLPPVDAGTYLA